MVYRYRTVLRYLEDKQLEAETAMVQEMYENTVLRSRRRGEFREYGCFTGLIDIKDHRAFSPDIEEVDSVVFTPGNDTPIPVVRDALGGLLNE